MNSAPAHWGPALAAVQELSGAHVPWLRALRDAAWARLEVPGRGDEAWKYSDAGALGRSVFLPARPPVAQERALPLPSPLVESAYRLVFVDGWWVAKLSVLPPGVEFLPLAATLERDPHRVISWFSAPHEGFMGQANTAFMSDGALLNIPAGMTLEHPLEVLHVSGDGAATMAHPHVVVNCGEGSRLELHERFTGRDETGHWRNPHTRLVLAAGARVKHLRLQEEGPGGFHTAALVVHQGHASRYDLHLLQLGARLARLELEAVLQGEEAQCRLSGLSLVSDQRHVDNHVRVEHRAAHCLSRQRFHSVAAGRGRAVFTGRVVVRPGARGSDAAQEGRGLLLSSQAEVDHRPQLEIHADEVKCAHGVSVGRLDEAALFYLRSRGLGEGEARRWLVRAFAERPLAGVPEPVLRHLRTVLERVVP